MGLRDSIFKCVSLPERAVVVPEWESREVIVRGMTAKERRAVTAQAAASKGSAGDFNIKKVEEAQVEMLLFCVLDPADHKPVFQVTDRDFLLDQPAIIIDRLVTIMSELSGTSPKALEDTEKN